MGWRLILECKIPDTVEADRPVEVGKFRTHIVSRVAAETLLLPLEPTGFRIGGKAISKYSMRVSVAKCMQETVILKYVDAVYRYIHVFLPRIELTCKHVQHFPRVETCASRAT